MSQRDNKHYITNMKILILISLALLTLSCQETKKDPDRQLKKNTTSNPDTIIGSRPITN